MSRPRLQRPALLAALALSLLAPPPARAAGPGAPLDLPAVLGRVLAANRDLGLSRALARAARAEQDEAGAARLPRIDLSAGFTHTDDTMSTPPAPLAPIDPRFFTGWDDQWSVHLGARQPLFTGGELSGTTAAAREGARAAEQDARERELALAFQGKELFYRLLLAQEQARIAGEQLANARAHAAEAGTRLRAGDVSRFESLRARVRAANLEQPLAAAERARGEAAAELSRLMGAHPDPGLAVAGELAVSDDSLPAGAGTVARPSVAAAAARWRQAVSLAEAAEAPRWPRLFLTGSYDTRADETGRLFTPRHDNWSAGLSLEYNLFDGGASFARRARAAARLEGAVEAQAGAAQAAALDRERALLAMREAKASRASAGQTVAEAKEALAIARVAWSAGTASHLDVVDAEVGLAAARTRQAEADYRFLAARALWDYANGSLPPEVSR